jgi:hypothetical protein
MDMYVRQWFVPPILGEKQKTFPKRGELPRRRIGHPELRRALRPAVILENVERDICRHEWCSGDHNTI